MKLKLLFYLLIISIALSSCRVSHKSNKSKRVMTLQMVEPYKKCEDPIKIYDKPIKPHILTNLSDLSYSTAYTSIYTHHFNADSLEKDSIRFLYAKNLKGLVKNTFPSIEITNDSVLLRKNYWYMVRYSKAFILNKRYNERIEKYTTKAYESDKQLFIKITSSLGKIKFPNRIGIYVFDIKKNILLYHDYLEFDCDIRDYEALEKVISYGLLKLKENFE